VLEIVVIVMVVVTMVLLVQLRNFASVGVVVLDVTVDLAAFLCSTCG
jgi:hypothetical protein